MSIDPSLVPPRVRGPLRVVQISDVHISGSMGRDQAGDAAAFAAELAPFEPDVVVVSGDLAEVDPRRTEDAEAAHQWVTALAATLRVVVLVIPGNHDIGENGEHDEIAPEWRGQLVSSGFVADFRARWGHDRFRYSASGVTLVGINSQLLGSGLPEENEQFTWLRSQPAGSSDPWVLFTHQPLLLPDGSGPTKHWGLPHGTAREKLWRVLAEAGTMPAAVIGGHLHCYSSRQVGTTMHVTCPSLSHTVPEEALDRLAESDAVTGFLVHDFGPGEFSHWLVPRAPGVAGNNSSPSSAASKTSTDS
jgi:3',5'-cyclic AMP phosphodiesterase CpdA